MKIKFFKYISILIIFLLLNACNNAYVNHESKFCMNSINNALYQNPFIVCASFYTNEANIFSTAEIYCFKYNKKPKLLKINYFTNCSLIKPISYVFLCE